MNGGKLCVTDVNIPITGVTQNLSVKQLLSIIIDNYNWNSSNQQDASEALSLILDCLQNQETYENIDTKPFGFCTHTWR